jgi:uncharacterized protein (TIGR00369 family)
MTKRVRLETIPYARFLGVQVEETGKGLVCVLPFRHEIVGNDRLPAVHGGVVGAFLELTAFMQLLADVSAERAPKPISFNIDYLRSAGPHDMRGRAEIVKYGRRIANVRVLAWQTDAAKPVAAGIGNFLL